MMNAQQELIENGEEQLIRQMEIDTELEMRKKKEEEALRKIRDERKEIEGIYNDFLVKKHP